MSQQQQQQQAMQAPTTEQQQQQNNNDSNQVIALPDLEYPLLPEQLLPIVPHFYLTAPQVKNNRRSAFIQLFKGCGDAFRCQLAPIEPNSALFCRFGAGEPMIDENTKQIMGDPRKWQLIVDAKEQQQLLMARIDNVIANILSQNSKIKDWKVGDGKGAASVEEVLRYYYQPCLTPPYVDDKRPDAVFPPTIKTKIVVMTPEDESKFNSLVVKQGIRKNKDGTAENLENILERMSPQDRDEYEKFMSIFTAFYLYDGIDQDGNAVLVPLGPRWSEIRPYVTGGCYVVPVIRLAGVFWAKKICVSMPCSDVIIFKKNKTRKGVFAGGNKVVFRKPSSGKNGGDGDDDGMDMEDGGNAVAGGNPVKAPNANPDIPLVQQQAPPSNNTGSNEDHDELMRSSEMLI